jgi:tyrosinase
MDRIVALYQYRYPDTWVEDAEQAMGTFTMPKGSVQGADSPLTPFHMNADGDMWTSTSSQNWTSFGYTYPELMSKPTNESFTSSLNKLYKPQTQGLNSTNATIPLPGGNATNVTTQAMDWLCEVNMPTDIKISYSVRAFLGEPNADPKKWATDPNYVGQLASMSSRRMSSNVIVTGSIALTEKLAQKHRAGELKSLDKDDVATYLKANFSWRIQALDFTEIPRNNPPAGLNVTVFHVPVRIPKSNTDVPTWNGDIQYNHDIEGNPPVYDGPGPHGTNSTLPADEIGGTYDAKAGQYQWKNVTNGDAGARQSDPPTTMRSTLVSTRYVTSSTPAASTTASLILSSAAVETPEPTDPAGPQTTWVTSIVYVTM